jgi:hypothetical protein
VAGKSKEKRPMGSEAGHAVFSESFTTDACSRRLSAKQARSWPRRSPATQSMRHNRGQAADKTRRRGNTARRSAGASRQRIASRLNTHLSSPARQAHQSFGGIY